MKTKNMLWLVLALTSTTACQDEITNPPVPIPGERTVQVPLTLGFDEETDGYATPAKRDISNGRTAVTARDAFETRLTSPVPTRTADPQPDALYELHIIQYEPNGNLIGSVQYTAGATPLGQQLSVTLSPRDDCQLVIIARGKGNTAPGIGGNLAAVQNLSIPKTVFDAIPAMGATQEQMNKMPYVLHLKHVKIGDAGNGKGIIQSAENGTNDVRLRLKRLAAKLTINWTIDDALQVKGYYLKEVRLCQVPELYGILPQTEETRWGTAYPLATSNFIDPYRLVSSADIAQGTKTIWIPANVRGTSPEATALIHRTKANAPIASSYMEMVVDNAEKKERLYYRAYLGGKDPTDFNLRENTDYNWNIHINTTNYASDPRIQFLDQTPVQSTNLVNTANCIMLQPGGNLNFNPYKHTAGTNGWNDYLVNTPEAIPAVKTPIDHVRVLWQMKDNGLSGDLVMGYVIDENNHVNLVNITDAANIEKARVHVKAPLTNGGNAVIAAYDAAGTILWSWHLWITNYVPKGMNASTNYTAAQQASRNGTVHQYANAIFQSGIYKDKVTMDRNLGATAGDFPGKDASVIEFIRRAGVVYQWGRKDPMFNSVDGTTNEKNVVYDGFANPINMDKPKYNAATMLVDGNTLKYTIQHPFTFICGADHWYSGGASTAYHELWAKGGIKTIYDPCPDGWRTPDKEIWRNITVDNAYWFNNNNTFVRTGSAHTRGGRLYSLNGTTGAPPVSISIHNYCWFPASGYRAKANGNIGAPTNGYLYPFNVDTGNNRAWYIRYSGGEFSLISNGGYISESQAVRCVQE